VAKAVAVAGRPDFLTKLRGSLRERVLESPLCSPRRIGAELESALRMMWEQWVSQR